VRRNRTRGGPSSLWHTCGPEEEGARGEDEEGGSGEYAREAGEQGVRE